MEHAGRPASASDGDSSYLRHVLRLEAGLTEYDMEQQLKRDAQDLGVGAAESCSLLPLLKPADIMVPVAPPQTPSTSSTEVVSRPSQESLASHSTSMTSLFSDMSQHQTHLSGAVGSRTSLSIRDYDAFLARGAPTGRHSISFSRPTTPFSLPLHSAETSLPKKHFRRLRGLSMLRLNRNTSSTSLSDACPHCPQDSESRNRAVHKLPCGHRLCTQALRKTIQTATITGELGAIPSCCSMPISGQLIEHVMTSIEQQVYLERLEQWDEAASIAPSVASARDSVMSRGPFRVAADVRAEPHDCKMELLAPRPRKDLAASAASHSAYKDLRRDQDDEEARFQAWMHQQHSQLQAHHQSLRQVLKYNHKVATEDLTERHSDALFDAEDKQVKAEADMRDYQSQETRDNATALKHMEAYCAGRYSTGEPHHRVVTDQDRAELDKTQRMRDQMIVKHESQINVLRGEQSRRMRAREMRQEKEVQALRRRQDSEEVDFERRCVSDSEGLDERMDERRRRARVRWQLQTAIFVKRHEEAEKRVRIVLGVGDEETEAVANNGVNDDGNGGARYGMAEGFAA